MIDFENTKIRFDRDNDNRPYYSARGAKGKFEKVYLNDAEQQAHKEHEASKQVRQADVGRSALPDGPSGALGPGPCPAGASGTEGVLGVNMPLPLEAHETQLSPAHTLASRAVSLINSMGALSGALYAFGSIDNNCVGDLTFCVHNFNDQCERMDEDSSNGLMPAFAFVERVAANLYHTYNDDRSISPMFVVAEHVAPVVTMLQYLMGITFPDGDMAVRAQEQNLMFRRNASLLDLVEDMKTVYNNIQADLGYMGETLVGIVPEEVGGDLMLPEGLSKIGLVRAVDEMVQYLIQRVCTMTDLLNAEM